MVQINRIFYRVCYKILSVIKIFITKTKAQYFYSISDCSKNVNFGRYSYLINGQRDPQKLQIGEGTVIDGIIQIFPFGNGLKIGSYCYLGINSRIWVSDEITIGNNVLISHDVNIIDSNSHEINAEERAKSFINQCEKGLPKEKGNVKTAPIRIGNNVWISYNVCILKGISIGNGAIIACGSVVTKDVPENTMVAGNPAIVIKKLDSQ